MSWLTKCSPDIFPVDLSNGKSPDGTLNHHALACDSSGSMLYSQTGDSSPPQSDVSPHQCILSWKTSPDPTIFDEKRKESSHSSRVYIPSTDLWKKSKSPVFIYLSLSVVIPAFSLPLLSCLGFIRISPSNKSYFRELFTFRYFLYTFFCQEMIQLSIEKNNK